MKEFKVTWVDNTEYSTIIAANSKEEALTKFDNNEFDEMEPTGWVEMELDSPQVEEL